MMRRHLIAPFYRFLLYPAARVYWRTFRPRTSCVRIILSARADGRILLIRHTYGRRELWYPPGGGFRPGREDAADAARRETYEEVGLYAQDVVHLGQTETDVYGNRNTIHYFSGFADETAVTQSAEIADHLWIAPKDCETMTTLSIHVNNGLSLLKTARKEQ